MHKTFIQKNNLAAWTLILLLLITTRNLSHAQQKEIKETTQTASNGMTTNSENGSPSTGQEITQANESTNTMEPEDSAQPTIIKGILDNPGNELGIAYAQNQLDKASSSIQSNKFDEAKRIVDPVQKWLVTATEIHIELYQTLKKLTTAKTQSQLEKELALRYAILRDKANYQAGVIAVAQKNYKEAARYLSDVVKSQPKTDLGIKAYEIMQNIGFTEKVVLDVQ